MGWAETQKRAKIKLEELRKKTDEVVEKPTPPPNVIFNPAKVPLRTTPPVSIGCRLRRLWKLITFRKGIPDPYVLENRAVVRHLLRRTVVLQASMKKMHFGARPRSAQEFMMMLYENQELIIRSQTYLMDEILFLRYGERELICNLPQPPPSTEQKATNNNQETTAPATDRKGTGA